MSWFKSIPTGAVVIVMGVIAAIGWVTLEGTVPLVISIIAGGVIALRAVLDAEDAKKD